MRVAYFSLFLELTCNSHWRAGPHLLAARVKPPFRGLPRGTKAQSGTQLLLTGASAALKKNLHADWASP
jgi:hypothetical protein